MLFEKYYFFALVDHIVGTDPAACELYIHGPSTTPKCNYLCMHNLLFSHAGRAFYMSSPAPCANGSTNYQRSDTVGSSLLLLRVNALMP